MKGNQQGRIQEICQAHGNDPGRLMDIAREIQQEFGSVSSDAFDVIGEALSIPRVEVESLVSFYSFLSPKAQGKVVIHRNRGERLPEGWIIDASGKPSTDPNVLFDTPHGWILPAGGNVGYKGFAMLVLAEILAGTLTGKAITDETPDGTNGACFVVIDISAFAVVESFRDAIGIMTAYMKSAPPAPGFEEVLMPGELDFRIMRERRDKGIPIDAVTWQRIKETAEALQVPLAVMAQSSSASATQTT